MAVSAGTDEPALAKVAFTSEDQDALDPQRVRGALPRIQTRPSVKFALVQAYC